MSAAEPKIPRLRIDLEDDTSLTLNVRKRWESDKQPVVMLSIGRYEGEVLIDGEDGSVIDERFEAEYTVELDNEALRKIALFFITTNSVLDRTRYRFVHGRADPQSQVEAILAQYDADLRLALEPWVIHAKDGYELMQAFLRKTDDKTLAQRMRDWMKRAQFREY